MARILVIDDDLDFLVTLRMVLEAHGFEMDSALTPEEGISKTLDGNPDLVILDVMMPTGYEGFEVARSLREVHRQIDLPILMLTSVHETKQVPYRFAPDEHYLPVDSFLDKPIDPDQLIDTIERMLGQRREEPEHPL